MKVAAAASLALAALAAGCSDGKKGEQPLPPAVSLGAPAGGGEAAPMPGMPSGHPGMSSPHGAGGMEAPAGPPAGALSVDRFKAPEGWQGDPPSSSMKIAQFHLPRADGDGKDGQVDVYGNRMGETDANIARWRGQFAEVAHGKDAVEEITAGLKGKVTLLDITGKFSGGMMPGGAAPHGGGDEDVARMLAAVIELPEGTGYVKAYGPPNTIAKWEKSIREFILASAK